MIFSSDDAAIDDVAEVDGVGEPDRDGSNPPEATQLCETDPASETNESTSREASGLPTGSTGGNKIASEFLDLEAN